MLQCTKETIHEDCRVRLANVDDAKTIIDIQNECMLKCFRLRAVKDVTYLIDYAVLSITLLNSKEQIIGFLALKDYPPIPSIHPSVWEEYIWTKYKLVDLNARNTLFIHALIWRKDYGREAVDQMLKSVFMHDLYLENIAMVKMVLDCPLLVPGKPRPETSFRRVMTTEKGVCVDNLPIMAIAERTGVCPRLKVRRAVEEDNDDLLPIIERHSDRLTKMYGEFYISELIGRHPESDRVLLVCEDKDIQQAVGVMCLNTTINYEALEEGFNLSPYAGLRHLKTKPKFSSASRLDISSEITFSRRETTVIEKDTNKKGYSGLKINWIPDNYDSPETRELQTQPDDVTTIPDLDVIKMLNEDEDEMEFEIINIARCLLRVPHKLVYNSGPNQEQKHYKLSSGSVCDIDVKTSSLQKMLKIKQEQDQEQISIHTTRYDGEPNAFLLELFAMHPDYDERHGFEVLEVAFEVFPGRDYCVICLPSLEPPFALLEHFTYVTPQTHRLSFVDESLYVAHVNSVRGKVSARPAEAFDQPYISDILEMSSRRDDYMKLYETSLNSYHIKTYVFLSEKQPIGMAVVGSMDNSAVVRTRFDLPAEPFRTGNDGNILAAVVSPVLTPHYRWFMRELIRLDKYTMIFWMVQLIASDLETIPLRNLTSLFGRMVPMRPRRSLINISKNYNVEQLLKKIDNPFALWVISRPLSAYPKVEINNNIVVIGASTTGLAFLEKLVIGPHAKYITFNNVTLISEMGLPSVTDCYTSSSAWSSMPIHGRYSPEYLKSVPFNFYVDVIIAVMIKIDRKKKCIYLQGGSVKFYDTLVLTIGEQFQHPEYMMKARTILKNMKGPCVRLLMDNPLYTPDKVEMMPDLPYNVLIANTLYEANFNMRRLTRLITEESNKSGCLSKTNTIILYGECIELYCCLTSLLAMGVSPEHITIVEPFPSKEDYTMRVNCFNNEFVDAQVRAKIEEYKIKVYRETIFVGWRLNDQQRVSTTRFLSPLHAFQLQTFALFYYGIKDINLHAFKAINECGLVYDGGLVIGPTFLTNDPTIYAAGPCTKYSRRLYADKYKHRHYNSEEIGEELAEIFLKALDPYRIASPQYESVTTNILTQYSKSNYAKLHITDALLARVEKPHTVKTFGFWEPVAKYSWPLMTTAVLPGPLYYVRIRKPGPDIPFAVEAVLPRQGHTMVTDHKNNYFCIKLNDLHRVESITCLSHEQFDYHVIQKLYGLHEAFFNRLLYRYQKNKIKDFYDFFYQPWMSALYQESFNEVMDKINNHMFGNTEDNLKRFEEILEDYVARNTSLDCRDETGGDIPSECGQSEKIRGEAKAFWRVVGGEKALLKYIARYLHTNQVVTMQYAYPVTLLSRGPHDEDSLASYGDEDLEDLLK